MGHLNKIKDLYRQKNRLYSKHPSVSLSDSNNIDYFCKDTPMIYTLDIPAGGKTVRIIPPEVDDIYTNVISTLKQLGETYYSYMFGKDTYPQTSISNGDWILSDVKNYFNSTNWDSSWDNMSGQQLISAVTSALSTESGRNTYLVSTGNDKTFLDWIVSYYDEDGISKLIAYLTSPDEITWFEVKMLKEIFSAVCTNCDSAHQPDGTYLYFPHSEFIGVTLNIGQEETPPVLFYEKVNVNELRQFFHFSETTDDLHAQLLVVAYAAYAHVVTDLSFSELLKLPYSDIWNLGADMYQCTDRNGITEKSASILQDDKVNMHTFYRPGKNNGSMVRKVYIDDVLQDGIPSSVTLDEGEHTIKLYFKGKIYQDVHSGQTDHRRNNLMSPNICQLTFDETIKSLTLPESFTMIPFLPYANLQTLHVSRCFEGFLYRYTNTNVPYSDDWAGINPNLQIITDNPGFKQDGGIFILDGKQLLSVETTARLSRQAHIFDFDLVQFPNVSEPTVIEDFVFPDNSFLIGSNTSDTSNPSELKLYFQGTVDLGKNFVVDEGYILSLFIDSSISTLIIRNQIDFGAFKLDNVNIDLVKVPSDLLSYYSEDNNYGGTEYKWYKNIEAL